MACWDGETLPTGIYQPPEDPDGFLDSKTIPRLCRGINEALVFMGQSAVSYPYIGTNTDDDVLTLVPNVASPVKIGAEILITAIDAARILPTFNVVVDCIRHTWDRGFGQLAEHYPEPSEDDVPGWFTGMPFTEAQYQNGEYRNIVKLRHNWKAIVEQLMAIIARCASYRRWGWLRVTVYIVVKPQEARFYGDKAVDAYYNKNATVAYWWKDGPLGGSSPGHFSSLEMTGGWVPCDDLPIVTPGGYTVHKRMKMDFDQVSFGSASKIHTHTDADFPSTGQVPGSTFSVLMGCGHTAPASTDYPTPQDPDTAPIMNADTFWSEPPSNTDVEKKYIDLFEESTVGWVNVRGPEEEVGDGGCLSVTGGHIPAQWSVATRRNIGIPIGVQLRKATGLDPRDIPDDVYNAPIDVSFRTEVYEEENTQYYESQPPEDHTFSVQANKVDFDVFHFLFTGGMVASPTYKDLAGQKMFQHHGVFLELVQASDRCVDACGSLRE